MPDSMYDRLGDMLSVALESGDFFKADAKNNVRDKADNDNDKTKKNGRGQTQTDTFQKKRRPLSDAQKKAFSLLGIAEDASLEDAKKAYRAKLKYYHPDRHGDNPVLQKVARDKTRQVIESWEIVGRYFDAD